MKSLKLYTFLIFFVVLVGIVALFAYLKPKISLYSTLTIQKCDNLRTDDCWHALAHQTLNSTYCLKITDNETREHCFEHVPEIDKENK